MPVTEVSIRGSCRLTLSPASHLCGTEFLGAFGASGFGAHFFGGSQDVVFKRKLEEIPTSFPGHHTV